MKKNVNPTLRAALAVLVTGMIIVPAAPAQVWTDPARAGEEDPDYLIQGEYGSAEVPAEGMPPWGVQVVAEGGGAFTAYLLEGGLPGAGFTGKRTGRRAISGRHPMKGTRDEAGAIRLTGEKRSALIEKGIIVIIHGKTGNVFVLPRLERESPTLDAKPPEGAVVLFDGTEDSLGNWKGGKLAPDGTLMAGTTSKQRFGSHRLHLEFRTPYKPKARGQGRGNSGLYVQGRFETQILDSFGLTGERNEAGGIYSIADCPVNACLPPLRWQTYDVDFTAAEFKDGKKVRNARMTVRLNGILIHDDQELPRATTASPLKDEPGPGPVYLQDHGNPVRFRNVWVVPR